MTGGGKKSGSGRGKKLNTAPAKKGGRKGGKASAKSRTAAKSIKNDLQRRVPRKEGSEFGIWLFGI